MLLLTGGYSKTMPIQVFFYILDSVNRFHRELPTYITKLGG